MPRPEGHVAPAGFTSLGVGDNLLVQQTDGSWAEAGVVLGGDAYTIRYRSGHHEVLQRKPFVVQTVTGVSSVTPGDEILVPFMEKAGHWETAVVIDSSRDLRVVAGAQGATWAWTESATPGDGSFVTVLHSDGRHAALQILDQSAVRMVPYGAARGGLSWLQLIDQPGMGIIMNPRTLYDDPSIGGNNSVPPLAWAVPGSHGSAFELRPMTSGNHLLQAVATLFDADGDGQLNEQELVRWLNAAMGNTSDQSKEDVARTGEQVKNLSPMGLASLLGPARVLAPVAINAMPGVWQTLATTRAKKTRPHMTPGDRLLWEVANVLVVKLGRTPLTSKPVTVYDGAPKATPADKAVKMMAALPSLIAIAESRPVQAKVEQAMQLARKAIASGERSPELIRILQEALIGAVKQAPQLVMVFTEALEDAWRAAPEVFGAIREGWDTAIHHAIGVFSGSDRESGQVLVSIQTFRVVLSVCKDGIAHGATVGCATLQQARAIAVSVGAGLPANPGDVLATLEEVGRDAGTQMWTGLLKGMRDASAYCSRENLEQFIAAMRAISRQLPFAEAMAMLGSVGEEALLALGEMGIDQEALARAAASANAFAAGAAEQLRPLAQAAASEFQRFVAVAANRGPQLAQHVKDDVFAAIGTGAALSATAKTQLSEFLSEAMKLVPPGLTASLMRAFNELGAMVPSVGELSQVAATAAANARVALAILSDSDAMAALGGAAAAGQVVALTAAHQLQQAKNAGAPVAAHAIVQLQALGHQSAVAATVAAAEAREFAAVAAAQSQAAAGATATIAVAEAASARHAAAAAAVTAQEAVVAAGGTVSKEARAVARVVAADAAATAAEARAAAVQQAHAAAQMGQNLGAVGAKYLAMAPGAAAEAAANARGAAFESMEQAEPAVQAAANATITESAALRDKAIAASASGAGYAIAGGRAAASMAAIGAAAASQAVKDGVQAAVRALPDDAVASLQGLMSSAVNLGLSQYTQLAKITSEAYQTALDAGRSLAPLVPVLTSAVQQSAAAISSAAEFVSANAAPALLEARQVLGAAGAAAADAAGAAAGVAARAAQPVLEEVKEGAVEAAAVAGSAAAAAAVVATDVAHSAAVQGQAFFQSALATGQSVMNFPEVQDAYAQSREALQASVQALLGVGGGLMAYCTKIGLDLLKIEIIRDFYQMIGLFFASIYSESMKIARSLWGTIGNVIAFDWNFVIPSANPVYLYIIIAIIAFALVLSFLIFLCCVGDLQADTIREGYEAETWKQLAEKRKKSLLFVKVVLTGALSAYLPVSRTAIQILACEATMGRLLERLGVDLKCKLTQGDNTSALDARYQCQCSAWAPFVYLQILAVILLVGFTLLVPLRCYFLIKKNIPVGSREDPNMRYDEDGHKVQYTDAMYNYDLQNDPVQRKCPYLFLYEGFERRWAYYKVVVMVIKLCLCIPVIVWWDRIAVQSIVTLILLGFYAAFAWYSTPFISPTADVMDSSARLTALLVVAFAWIGSSSSSGVNTAFGILLHVVNFANLAVIIACSLWGIPAFRGRIRRCVNRLQFSDTCADQKGGAAKIVPRWVLYREVKHRIWHNFWQSLIATSMPEPVRERFHELCQITADVGRARIQGHFQSMATNPHRAAQRLWVQQNLEGVDVFYRGIPQDGKLDSVCCFGKMYVKPYPFECVMVYDDCDDYTFIHDDRFDEFVAQNRDPEVLQRRLNRQRLRGIAGRLCYWPHTREEMHTVPDGTETYTDSEGKTQTRTRHTTVPVMMTYTNGTLNVTTNTTKAFSAGLGISLAFADGVGVAVAPHTGQHHPVTGSYVMPGDGIGVTTSWTSNPTLDQFFANVGWDVLAQGVQNVLDTAAAYRQQLITQRAEKEQVLSSAFWLYVYDNATTSRQALETYFETVELNTEMKLVPSAHKAGLDFLFQRMAWVNSHPCCQLWFVFFDDVWDQNKDLQVIKDHPELFDPRNSNALTYRPMPRPELEKVLSEAGAHFPVRKVLFSKAVLDVFYTRMAAEDSEKLKPTQV